MLHNQTRFQFKNKNAKGFTLVELLVVIFIIGVLVSLLLANILGARQRATDVEKKANLQQVKRALRLFYNDFQSYPAAVGDRFTNEVTGGTPVPEGEEFHNQDNDEVIYMKEIPEYDEYAVTADGNRFVLIVTLDNPSDKDIESSKSRCATSLIETGASIDPDGDDPVYIVCED